MTRQIHRLSARTVQSLKEPGRHADGGGLYLRITKQGAKSWVFITTALGKTREIGLGAARSIGLASARGIAEKMREAVTLGVDPKTVVAVQVTPVETASITFKEFFDSYITSIEAGWKNPVHRAQWRQSIRDHAKIIHDMPIEEVDTAAVLRIVQPIWLTKPETASRVRGRIERILDAAKAQGHRSVDSSNPARFKGHLALLLPQQKKLSRGHHAALAWLEGPTFYKQLAARPALAARALQFAILTAARSGEVLGATWGEIDFDAKTWTIPGERMKASTQHIVPLSDAAFDVLAVVKPQEPLAGDVIFAVKGTARSNMAMAQLLKRMKHGHITVHGFRSTFRDWAGDATDYSRELIEQALAHTVTNKAERAYRRGTAIDKRRELMETWATYLGNQRCSEIP